jgi:hypothetical protein
MQKRISPARQKQGYALYNVIAHEGNYTRPEHVFKLLYFINERLGLN